MCELLGLNTNEPCRPVSLLRDFKDRGKDNKDGWGVAYYIGDRPKVVKEPVCALDSQLYEQIRRRRELNNSLMIAHVRDATIGIPITYENTHPFKQSANGKQYVFAHNGELSDYKKIPSGRHTPSGTTDSERLFCHILDQVEAKGIRKWEEKDLRWLHEKLKKTNTPTTRNDERLLTCILSDGNKLICYRDINGGKDLNYLEMKNPCDNVRRLDEDYEIDLDSDNHQKQRGYAISTRPLTDEKWVQFKPGQMIVFKDSNIIFDSNTQTDININV